MKSNAAGPASTAHSAGHHSSGSDLDPGATWVRSRARRVATGAVACTLIPASMLAAGIGGAAAYAAEPVAVSATGSYIVEATPGHVARAEADVTNLGGTVNVELSIVNGFSAKMSAAAASELTTSPDVAQVSPDAVTTVQGDGWGGWGGYTGSGGWGGNTGPGGYNYSPSRGFGGNGNGGYGSYTNPRDPSDPSGSYDPATDVGSPAGLAHDIGDSTYWAHGITGQGVGVALIDSGVAPVPALAASGKVFYGPDFTPTGYFPQVRGLDTFGHGTFMAGIIAGKDPGATASYAPSGPDYLGVAPDAHIVSVKVADAAGATMQSAVIAGIQWVIQHRNDPGLNIKVLNLSLGVRNAGPYFKDPLDAAVEAAWKSGITVVAAAGNDGSVGMTAPADDPYVIAVAAVDPGATSAPWDDIPASFSDRGNGTRNPDIGAVGMHVVGPRDPGSAIDQQYGATSAVTPSLMRGSGTSEAAAIVSGASALLLAQRPGLTPDQVKATLAAHATFTPPLTFAMSGAGELSLTSVFHAPTETRTQSWRPATVANDPAPSSVLNAPASTSPSGATWTGATWTAATWTGATWTGATWTGATWTAATWTAATWTAATWTAATWTAATWTAATWTTYSWK